MRDATREQIHRLLGSTVADARALSGGDINEAWSVHLTDGRRIFVKTHASPPSGMFEAEARGLGWLAEAGALRIPQVIAASPTLLALEMLDPGPHRADFDETLGRGLATLHRFGAPSFGLDHDNFIGKLPQSNETCERWSDFFRERRLEPQLDCASRGRLLPARLRTEFDRLFAVLADRVGPDEPPSRLHGDLWGGNLHADERGAPCLIDPASYGGHREVDLAMMQLFGGFGERVFAAYDETWPLDPGWRDRVPLYQLYPLLVHVNLFGSSYVGSVERALAALL